MNLLMEFLYQQSDFTIILLVTSAMVTAGLLLYRLYQFIFSPFKIKEDPYFGVTIIGTALSLCALLLIFTLIQAMGNVSQTHKLVVVEVESLYKVKSNCSLVNTSSCLVITNALDQYVRAILSSDWPKPPDNDTVPQFDRLVHALRDVIRATSSDSLERPNLLGALDSMIKSRHERMLNTGKEIPKVFYEAATLLLVTFVAFFYFLSPKKPFSQLSLALMLTFLGTLMGLVIVYDHPYEGDSGITQAEFHSSLQSLLKN